MTEFDGKVAVVTGAAAGIGRGLAETFAAARMKVVLSDIDAPALDETTRALRSSGADVYALVADVASAGCVDELARQTLRRYGGVHVLCNNAGIFVGGQTSWTRSVTEWQRLVDVNLMSVVHGIRAFLPIMIDQGSDAHIVNTASIVGLVANGSTLYGTTKSAVIGLSEHLYVELRRGGFKPGVSVLCPGRVDTDLVRARQVGKRHTAVTPRPYPWTRSAKALTHALSPREVGAHVLRAIRQERLFVLTHPAFTPLLEQRMNNILGGRNPIAPVVPPQDGRRGRVSEDAAGLDAPVGPERSC